ncbi:hypothetical protein GCM10009525_45730 [Streptosporangium amethystogenes subsp. fukuiense]
MNLAYVFSVKARFARARHHLAQAHAAEPQPPMEQGKEPSMPRLAPVCKQDVSLGSTNSNALSPKVVGESA